MESNALLFRNTDILLEDSMVYSSNSTYATALTNSTYHSKLDYYYIEVKVSDTEIFAILT